MLTNQRRVQGRGASVVTRWARRAIQELEVFTSERGKIPEQTRTEPGAPTQWELSYLRQIPTPAIKPRVGPTVAHTLRLFDGIGTNKEKYWNRKCLL